MMHDAFVTRAQHRLKLRYGQRTPGGGRLWMGQLRGLLRAVWIEHQETTR